METGNSGMHTAYSTLQPNWSFVEKTSEKQSIKRKVCSNFQMSFLPLVRWTPLWMKLRVRLTFLSDLWVRWTFGQMYLPLGEALDQVDIFVRSLGQTDLWSDVPPIGEVLGQVRSLGQAELWSDVPPTIGKALSQVDIFVRSLGQTDLWSDVPPIGEVLGQVRSLGEADLWSDVPTP